MSRELINLDLAQVARAIAKREVSSVEATQACLAQIRDWQPEINAFIRLDMADALRVAAERDAEIARGQSRGPLHGVPLAHKDLFYRRGRVTTAGSKILVGQVATTTATVLERLDAAGAVDLGTLNMAEFAAGPTGHNVHHGDCRNPFERRHITGGSSSGSAAAVAARMVFGALGTDTGASVRIPAGLCGVLGLKPTYGRVSRHGVFPRSWSLDHVGPLARTAADCALLMKVVSGHDPSDPSSSHRQVPDFEAAVAEPDLNGIRIGVPGEKDMTAIDAQVGQALADSLDVLRRCGATVHEVLLPDLPKLSLLAEAVVKPEAASIHRDWIARRPQDYASQVRVRIEPGFFVPATQYIDALRLRQRALEAYLSETMAEVDLLHLPLVPFPVPTIAEMDVEEAAGEEVLELVRRITTFTRPLNYLGVPAISVPCGFCDRGLPIAFQLAGPPFSEALLLKAAAAYQGETGFHQVAPRL